MKVSYHNQPVVPPLKVVPSKSSMATLHKSGSNVNLGAEDNPEKGWEAICNLAFGLSSCISNAITRA